MLKEKEKAIAKTERVGIEPYEPLFTIPVLQHPFALMRKMTDELDRIFGEFGFKQPPADRARARWLPDVEVFEKEGLLLVRIDLPGLTKEDVKVEITDEVLTIEGERKHEREEKDEGYFRSERSYGTFFRSIALPQGVDAAKARATFTNGVLEVTMPVPERKASGRTLPIDEVTPVK